MSALCLGHPTLSIPQNSIDDSNKVMGGVRRSMTSGSACNRVQPAEPFLNLVPTAACLVHQLSDPVTATDAPRRQGRDGIDSDGLQKAGALIMRWTVAKLSQNPIHLTQLGITFERKQTPRIVGNVRNSLNAKEPREADRIRPRQVRYQAALRPD